MLALILSNPPDSGTPSICMSSEGTSKFATMPKHTLCLHFNCVPCLIGGPVEWWSAQEDGQPNWRCICTMGQGRERKSGEARHWEYDIVCDSTYETLAQGLFRLECRALLDIHWVGPGISTSCCTTFRLYSVSRLICKDALLDLLEWSVELCSGSGFVAHSTIVFLLCGIFFQMLAFPAQPGQEGNGLLMIELATYGIFTSSCNGKAPE